MSILLFLAAAAANSVVGQAPQAKKMANEDKIVCKSERFVGSHMSERICKPRSEWEAARKRTKEFLDTERVSVDMCMGDNGGNACPSMRNTLKPLGGVGATTPGGAAPQ